ncbi:MAG: glucose 1-dehydrogenase [Pseudomonadota bacterium]
MNRLQNKTALITGAAMGLGAGIAQRFAEEGARLMLTDINAVDGAATAERLNGSFVPHDVTDEAAWENAVAATLERFGQLDVLVNNAGIFSNAPIEETELSQWQQVMNVNLTGVFLGCKHGVRAMLRGNGGSIINLSSVTGLRGQRGGSAYSASKGGVRLLTKTVALENAQRSIRCNSIHPGIIRTPILDPIFAAAEDADALEQRLAASLPIGYLGDPAADIGNTAVFLASEESRYITGAELVVDGGMTIGLP